jgi:hypothetical protein
VWIAEAQFSIVRAILTLVAFVVEHPYSPSARSLQRFLRAQVHRIVPPTVAANRIRDADPDPKVEVHPNVREAFCDAQSLTERAPNLSQPARAGTICVNNSRCCGSKMRRHQIVLLCWFQSERHRHPRGIPRATSVICHNGRACQAPVWHAYFDFKPTTDHSPDGEFRACQELQLRSGVWYFAYP